jgi:hypothetical protein
MTAAEHGVITQADNPQIAEMLNFKVAIECVNVGSDTVVAHYDTRKGAIEAADVSPGELDRLCDTGDVHQGLVWRRVIDTTTDLPGEKWVTITSNVTDPRFPRGVRDLRGVKVSDLGRVSVSGRKSFGSRLIPDTSAPTFKLMGCSRTVARAVCTAFHGPCPSPDAHVMHIDGDCANNHRHNLGWVKAYSAGFGNAGEPPAEWAVTVLVSSAAERRVIAERVAGEILEALLARDQFAALCNHETVEIQVEAMERALATCLQTGTQAEQDQVVDIFGIKTTAPYCTFRNIVKKGCGLTVTRKDPRHKDRRDFKVLLVHRAAECQAGTSESPWDRTSFGDSVH